MLDVVLIVVPVAACIGMLWLASRLEPHWVAKDGTRFLTTTQIVDRRGMPVGRRREVRLAIQDNGTLLASHRSLLRTNSQTFRLAGKWPNPPRRRAVYVLEPIPPDADGLRMAVRVPADSRIIPTLDGLLARAPAAPPEIPR